MTGFTIKWFLIGLGAEQFLESLQPESAGFMPPSTFCDRKEWGGRSKVLVQHTGMEARTGRVEVQAVLRIDLAARSAA